MSRTYRKNFRRYRKYDGVLYNTCNDILKDHKFFETLEWNYKQALNESVWKIFHGGRYNVEVKVIESDCWHLVKPKGVKSMCNRIDRARAKQAMIRDPENCYYTPSFDPWDWD